MKTKLTLKQAFYRCARMWRWLEQNPDKIKFNYFQEQFKPNYKYPAGRCWACQYVKENIKDFIAIDCAHGKQAEALAICPLKDLWPDGCMNNESPYLTYESLFLSEFYISRQAMAKRIADFSWQKYRELAVKEKTKHEHTS